MKIQFMSDLHVEFLGYNWDIPATDADLVVLAGDIGNGLKGVEWVIRQSETLNKLMVMVLGNHDLYNDDFTLYERAREYTKGSRVAILEKNIAEFMGFRILGTTLWTDYLLYGPAGKVPAMESARSFMADHKFIWNEDHIFTPEDALKKHEESLEWLNTQLQHTGPNIVVTHHAPNAWASNPKYRNDSMTPAFASDLEGFIIERKPVLWISGHSHHVYQKYIGDTLCISNTKGYPREGIEGFDPNLIVEV